jgi:hypothetical protein
MVRRMDLVWDAAEPGAGLRPSDQIIVALLNARIGAITGPTTVQGLDTICYRYPGPDMGCCDVRRIGIIVRFCSSRPCREDGPHGDPRREADKPTP